MTSLKAFVRRRGRTSFLAKLGATPWVLDVGCGNGSPVTFKKVNPNMVYVGLDIHDDNQGLIADEYIITTPEQFPEAIEQRCNSFDAIVCNHNIEHCLFPSRTLRAIVGALKEGGKLYLAFPCSESERFPSRIGTLNFYDDPTHCYLPDVKEIVEILYSEGCRVEFLAKRYRPILPFIFGLVLEPLSILTRKCMPLSWTWALYGFETVIWATRADS
jgi:SAM-dependent methyltransferase